MISSTSPNVKLIMPQMVSSILPFMFSDLPFPAANTLFRGNSIFTKTVEQAMTFFGRPFLEASVGPPLQDLCFDKIEIETDPNRNQKGQKDVEASGKLLVQWCERFWNNILMKKDYCPTYVFFSFPSGF